LRGIDSGVTYPIETEQAFKGAHALVILTQWKRYAALDFAKIFARMQNPAFVLTGA